MIDSILSSYRKYITYITLHILHIYIWEVVALGGTQTNYNIGGE